MTNSLDSMFIGMSHVTLNCYLNHKIIDVALFSWVWVQIFITMKLSTISSQYTYLHCISCQRVFKKLLAFRWQIHLFK